MRCAAVFAIIAASFLAASPAAAQTGRAQVGAGQPSGVILAQAPTLRQPRAGLTPGPIEQRQPRFTVQAVRIIANNETGVDYAGSDEIYAVFRDYSGSGLTLFTSKFGDVDTGEIKRFGSAQRCITPIVEPAYGPDGYPISWRCDSAGAAGPLRFRVTLYESDGWSPMACARPPNAPPTPGNCDDDNLGNFVHAYTPAQLLAAMPRVGDTFERETRIDGYTFAYIVRRIADRVTYTSATGAVRQH